MTRKRKARKVAVGRGSVLLISGLLIGSAVLRIGLGAGAAVAEVDFGDELVLSQAQSDVPVDDSATDRIEVTSLLEALQAREARVETLEQRLDARAKAIEVAKVEVERRLVALEQTEAQLAATLSRAKTAAEDDLARLTIVYENMKPKDAAVLFGAMEPEFAAGFLARMKPEIAANVMSGLDPQAAYSISAILAGRNALAPKS